MTCIYLLSGQRYPWKRWGSRRCMTTTSVHLTLPPKQHTSLPIPTPEQRAARDAEYDRMEREEEEERQATMRRVIQTRRTLGI